MTLEQFEEAERAQDGRCAICQSEAGAHSGQRVLNADHDHKTGRFRALLCHRCNVALGQMGDDPERLRAAAAYLERFR